MSTGDLTDASGWDALWARAGRGGPLAALRGKLRWQREVEAMVGRLVDLVGEDPAHVLEVGCAPGYFLDVIGRLRPQHVLAGVDIAEGAIERMRADGVGADLFVGDVRTVELPRPYDLALSFGLIEHFDDPTEIVRAHVQHVRPGGYVAVTVPNYAAPPVRMMLERFSPRTLQTHNLDVMQPGKLAELFERAGLLDVRSGSASGPVLPSSLADRNAAGQLYRLASRVWNAGTSFVPGSERLWRAQLWVHGRVRE